MEREKTQLRGGGGVPHHEQAAAAAGFLAGGEETDQWRRCFVKVTAAEKRKRRGRLVQRASADPSPCCRTFVRIRSFTAVFYASSSVSMATR